MINSEKQLLTKFYDGENRLSCSYSQVECYLQCPYKWKLSYIDGLRSNSQGEALVVGSKVHEIFEHLVKEKITSKELSYEDFSLQWKNFIYRGNILFATEEGQDLVYGQHLKTFELYLNKETELQKIIMDKEVVGVEKGFSFPMELPFYVDINGEKYSEVYLNGSIDLMVEDFDEIVQILDYKSSRKKFDKKKLATNFQLILYKMAVDHLYGREMEVEGYFYLTRLNLIQKIVIDQERIDQTKKELLEAFKGMYKTKDYSPNISFLCPFCDFSKGVCKEGTDLCKLEHSQQVKKIYSH